MCNDTFSAPRRNPLMSLAWLVTCLGFFFFSVLSFPQQANAQTSQDCNAIPTSINDTNERAKIWADCISEFLPLGRTIVEPIHPTIEDLVKANTKSLRWSAQDVLSERLVLNRDRVISLYTDKANKAKSEMDIQLAQLYSISGPAGSKTEFDDFEVFLTSQYWFVSVAADVEIARHLAFIDAIEAEQYIRKAILKLPESGDEDLIREAYYNISIVAQLLALNTTDISTSYASSKVLLRLAAEQDRIIDRHTIVFNLAQTHGATFDYVATQTLTKKLLDYSLQLDDKRAMLGLGLHAVTLFESDQFKDSLPFFDRALKLAEEIEHPFFEVYILQSYVQATAAEGNLSLSEALLDRLTKIEGGGAGRLRTDIAQASLNAAQGKFEKAYNQQVDLSNRILSAYSKSLLQPRDILRLESAFQDSNLRELQPINSLETAEYGRISRQSVTGGMSENAFKALNALILETSIYGETVRNSSEKIETHKYWPVLDVIFSRSYDNLKSLNVRFRGGIGNTNQKDLALAQLFDDYIFNQEAGSIIPAPADELDPEIRAWTWLLRSRSASEQGNTEIAYQALEQTRYLVQRHEDISSNLNYDLYQQNLYLAALEGNPDMALTSALEIVKIAREKGRQSPIKIVMTETISALERAGHVEEALTLADQFFNYAIERDSESLSYSAYTKGRLLYKIGNYDRALLFLTESSENLEQPELEPLIDRVTYAASAGAGKTQKALETNKKLRTTLSRLNDGNLSETSLPFIRHAEAFLADDDKSVDAWKNWWEEELSAQQWQWQKQAELATQRSNAVASIISSEAQFNRNFANELDKRQKRISFLRIVFLVSAIAFLIGLTYLLYRLWALKRSKEKSKQASIVKGQFLNMIGHESRIRLQGISSFADSLKSSSISLEHLPTIQVISTQAGSLSRAISDLIATARILAGDTAERQEIFIAEDLRARVLETAPERIGKRDIAISFDISPNFTPILIERRYITTALDRLVKLAIKNTRAGTVEIRLSLEKSLRGPIMSAIVEDTGSGMAPSEIDSLMSIFEQDASGISRIDATEELDLPLAHQAVLALGGTMNVHSQIGEGTRVSFSVPVKPAAANDTPTNIG